MNDNYLPIGSVVFVKNLIAPLMIISYKNMNKSMKNRNIYYVAVPYPQGYVSINATYLFPHTNISKVIQEGYKDDTYEDYNKYLKGIAKRHKF